MGTFVIIVIVVLGFLILTSVFRRREARGKYYYVCPVEGCTFSTDSNVERATEIIAKSHEQTHDE